MTFHRMTNDDRRGDRHDRDRVDHRGLDLRLQPDVLLDVDGQALEDGVEDAAGLARRDHVGVERIEGLRVLPHGVGQGRPALDVLARLEDGGREPLVRLLLAQDVEALDQRQAGVDHHRELPGEDRQVLGGDARPLWPSAGLDAASLDFTWSTLTTRICSRRNWATSASALSATRSPLTDWPARVRPENAKVAMTCPRLATPNGNRPPPESRTGHHPRAPVDHVGQLFLHRRGVHARRPS